jgi:hypothetical protein
MNRKSLQGLSWWLAVSLFLPLLSIAQDIQGGGIFPAFDLKEGLSKKDYGYLGLSTGSIFSKTKTNLNDIKADLLFVQFLNKYCIVCQKDAPEFARFFQEIEADRHLKGKVKILGMAIGNSLKEVENFRREYSIGFPVFSDRESLIYRKIGSPRGSPCFSKWRSAGSTVTSKAPLVCLCPSNAICMNVRNSQEGLRIAPSRLKSESSLSPLNLVKCRSNCFM